MFRNRNVDTQRNAASTSRTFSKWNNLRNIHPPNCFVLGVLEEEEEEDIPPRQAKLWDRRNQRRFPRRFRHLQHRLSHSELLLLCLFHWLSTSYLDTPVQLPPSRNGEAGWQPWSLEYQTCNPLLKILPLLRSLLAWINPTQPRWLVWNEGESKISLAAIESSGISLKPIIHSGSTLPLPPWFTLSLARTDLGQASCFK